MKNRIKIGICLALLAVLGIWVLWGNTALEVNTYQICSDRIPKEFDGFRIAQISDFHNAEFDEGNRKLLSLMGEASPDLIVITGDMIDSRRTDVDIAVRLAEELVKLAPVYYVPGNHESRVGEYEDLKAGLTEAGITLLEDRAVPFARNGAEICLMGVMDPAFRWARKLPVTEQVLEDIRPDAGEYTVLLSHRPELYPFYVENQIDLVFSGHAHGGQFRLPLVGGLVAPDQGLFPKYDAGAFTENGTTMLVSRGIGNSIVPIRFNNRPEIVVAELRTA